MIFWLKLFKLFGIWFVIILLFIIIDLLIICVFVFDKFLCIFNIVVNVWFFKLFVFISICGLW